MSTDPIAVMHTPDEVCAVVVTYHPDVTLPRRLCREAGYIVIVDNHSEPSTLPLLREAAGEVLVNDQNVGLATALNQGVQRAKVLGYRFVILFDQDSEPMSGIVQALMQVYEAASKQFKVAIVGPNFINRGSGKPFSAATSDRSDWHVTGGVQTSGSLIPIAVFDVLGPFRDDFFIDGIDTEYALRARRHGYEIIQAHAVLMQHSAGHPQPSRFLNRTVWTTHHSPLRCYTIVRNSIFMWVEYAGHDSRWATQHLSQQLRWANKLLLYEPDRWAKFKAMLRGFRDGVLGRGGVPPALP